MGRLAKNKKKPLVTRASRQNKNPKQQTKSNRVIHTKSRAKKPTKTKLPVRAAVGNKAKTKAKQNNRQSTAKGAKNTTNRQKNQPATSNTTSRKRARSPSVNTRQVRTKKVTKPRQTTNNTNDKSRARTNKSTSKKSRSRSHSYDGNSSKTRSSGYASRPNRVRINMVDGYDISARNFIDNNPRNQHTIKSSDSLYGMEYSEIYSRAGNYGKGHPYERPADNKHSLVGTNLQNSRWTSLDKAVNVKVDSVTPNAMRMDVFGNAYPEQNLYHYSSNLNSSSYTAKKCSSPSKKPCTRMFYGQEFIVLVGCPYSGKTMWLRESTKADYVTCRWPKFLSAYQIDHQIRASISCGLPVVVDMENGNLRSRSRLIAIAREYDMKCICVHFKCTSKQARINAEHDLRVNYIKPDKQDYAKKITSYFRYLVPPTRAEGFCEVIEVDPDAILSTGNDNKPPKRLDNLVMGNRLIELKA